MYCAQDILLFLLPMISGYLTSYFCPVGDSTGSNVPARPDPYVFMIVWPILYILIGISWVNATKEIENDVTTIHIMYGFLIVLLCLWTYFYGCAKNKKYALYTILLSLLALSIIMLYSPTYLLLPLAVWLLFATMLNLTEVNKEGFSIIPKLF